MTIILFIGATIPLLLLIGCIYLLEKWWADLNVWHRITFVVAALTATTNFLSTMILLRTVLILRASELFLELSK